jgi:amino acid transporter
LEQKRFGTFSGVFVPSFEAILGAVLFLILPMLTGAMGLWRMALIVIIANTVTLATGFSIADCATNQMRIGGGGMYAVSRDSLGKAFGGSIGIQLFVAQSASIGFYAIGFAEPMQGILEGIPLVSRLIGRYDVLVQKQILATILAFAAFILGVVGANFVVKVQTLIFVVLILSVGAILISPLISPLVRFSLSAPLFSGGLNLKGSPALLGFWMAFTAFFPAVTGIDAGVGMSGNLKNPRNALPRGTFLAIGVTFLVYMAVTLVFSMIRPELLYETSESGRLVAVAAVSIFSGMRLIPVIILVGILVATCSSALAYFLSAPATAQALARDKVLPRFMGFLRRDFVRRGREPRWAAVLTLLIVLPVIWSGDVTTASMIVGICFLVVYGWVNLAAFFERLSGNPSFRPTSRGHWAISLYGFLVCMVVISLFNIWVGLGVLASQLLIFVLILHYKSEDKLEGVWWGVLFTILNWGFKRMRLIIQGTKNWRPIVGIFCLADRADVAENTFEIGKRITDFQGLTIINVLKPEKLEKPHFDMPEGTQLVEVKGDAFDGAITSIVQSAVPGGLQINTVLLPVDPRLNHIETIENIIEMDRNVLLYSHGEWGSEGSNRIDVWWKGEENGSLMALLSYIISSSEARIDGEQKSIRIIRKLFKDEDRENATNQLKELLRAARIKGEVLVLPEDNAPIQETIKEHSSDAYLILMGIPGQRAEGVARLFALDRYFFEREIQKFEDLPPLLFVKAHRVMQLTE